MKGRNGRWRRALKIKRNWNSNECLAAVNSVLSICLVNFPGTDLRHAQFFSLGADFFENSCINVHGSDPHAHWSAGPGNFLHLTDAQQWGNALSDAHRQQNLSLFKATFWKIAVSSSGFFLIPLVDARCSLQDRDFSKQTFSGMKSGLLMYFCSFSRICGLILSLS